MSSVFRDKAIVETGGSAVDVENCAETSATADVSKHLDQSDDNLVGVNDQDANDDDDELLDRAGAAVPRNPDGGPLSLSKAKEIKVDPSIDPVNKTLGVLANVLKDSGDYFCHDGQLVIVDDDRGLQQVTPQNFNAYVHPHLEIIKCRGERETYELFDQRMIRTLTGSPSIIRKKFQEIRYFTRMPSVVGDFRIVSNSGYDEASKVYYLGPSIEPAPDPGTLREVLSTFLWREAADAANFLGWLLTLVTMFLWPGRHPFAVFNANRPRLGKTTAARIAGLLMDGVVPPSISFTTNDDELEKRIATVVRGGHRSLLIDNAKRGKAGVITSAVLERCITDRTLNFRQLGTNRSIVATNYLAVMVTMNDARFGPDLMQRSLPINLFLEGDPRDHTFPHADLEDYVLENRPEILASLLGMVRDWRDSGRPPTSGAPARHTISQEWAATIDGILHHAGHKGFLTNFSQAERDFDPDYQLLRELLPAGISVTNTPADWAAWITTEIPESAIGERLGRMTRRGQATTLGRLFNRNLGMMLAADGTQVELVSDSSGDGHHSRRYGFKANTAGNEADSDA